METAEPAVSNARTLAQLEARVRELEESLSKAQASAVALRARMLADGLADSHHAGKPFFPELPPETLPSTTEVYDNAGIAEDGADRPALPKVTLAALPPLHVLRIKWHLEEEFPPPSEENIETGEDSPRSAAKHEGRLRLFGLLEDGSPWECSILYSNLMNANGITIGREAADADIVLNDPSISRCHIRLGLTDDGVVVSDEHSTNGTSVNSTPLDSYNAQTALSDGDILGVAEIALKVELL